MTKTSRNRAPLLSFQNFFLILTTDNLVFTENLEYEKASARESSYTYQMRGSDEVPLKTKLVGNPIESFSNRILLTTQHLKKVELIRA